MTARFAAGSDLMSIAEALARLESRVEPARGDETLALHECLGRVLAEDVVSSVNVPPHDNSAVDGWAFRRADLPEANSQAIFRRMQTEREREAKEVRAQGAEVAQRIRAAL